MGLISLTACVTKPDAPQIQVGQQSLSDQLNIAVAYSTECLDKYNNHPDFLLTYQEIYLQGTNPPNKIELLTSNKRLNSKQKKAFQNYIKLTGACTEGVMSRIQGSPLFSLFQRTDALLDVNESSLLADKITIGEANARKLDITQKFYSDISSLQRQYQPR